MLTRAGARREEERTRAAFDSIPNDVLVSIFDRLQHEDPEPVRSRWVLDDLQRFPLREWVRETMPLVCRRWRDLYRSQQASPLHETLELDFGDGIRPRALNFSAEGVISWARRHCRDVRRLRVLGTPLDDRPFSRFFTPDNLTTLLETLAPHLDEIEIGAVLGTLEPSFFASMRNAVAPAARLRKLEVWNVGTRLFLDDVAFLGQLQRLEELILRIGGRYGELCVFPASVLTLPNLRRLGLSSNWGITEIPAGISSLQRLESFSLCCSLHSLPEELGQLKRMTSLDLGGSYLGATAADVAFPAALRGMTSLRHLGLRYCNLRAVPRFVGDLRALEILDLEHNRELGRNVAEQPHDGFPSPFPVLAALTRLNLSHCELASVPTAVLSSMPQLRVLDFSFNSVTSLPEGFGQRLTQLREVDLSHNYLEALPLRALAGARNLEKINCTHRQLQVEEPLDWLLEEFPRLREVRLSDTSGERRWTPTSRANLERFAAALRERDPTAIVVF